MQTAIMRDLHRMGTGLMAVLVAAAVVSTTAWAAAPRTKLIARPLTSDDIAVYKLPALELSGGLTTVGVGQPAYLEAELDLAVPASDIVSTTWEVTYRPSGSVALLTDSPLGSTVPIFEPSDRLVFQVVGRKLLRPDRTGPYFVTATITTTTATITASQTFIAANYVGFNTCSLCHSGGLADVKVPDWSKTHHAKIFKDGINGVAYPGQKAYPSSCWGCHTVGYDPKKTAPNGGFDDVMKQLGWTPPTVLQTSNWDAVPWELKNVANIQCENCHGPGSVHAHSGGSPIAISVSTRSGDCNQCHSAAPHHFKGAEWVNSKHAVATAYPSGAGREACVGCHSGVGFMQRMKAAKSGKPIATVNASYEAINCQTCHEPHGQTAPDATPHQLRSLAPVKLAEGTVVKSGGAGLLCMNCHQARVNAVVYVATTKGNLRWGPHHGPQADMLQGLNGITYGQSIPSSGHRDAVKDTCVTCHMQAVDSKDPAFTLVGGHTFKISMDATDKLPSRDLVAACQSCHGKDVSSFDLARIDYNNDGLIEGVQTEVQHLMDQLSSMLPPNDKPKTALAVDATWTPQQLQAAYNWQYVHDDGSNGIHNTAYTVGLLKASIKDLGGAK